jgi:hypothetical protein
MFGAAAMRNSNVDQALSKELRDEFAAYQASLNLKGRDGFGVLTADNYDKYLLEYYLYPSADKFLAALADEKRDQYLQQNPWIKWSGKATFTFADYVAHCRRSKGLPAFDDFNMQRPETIEFGDKSTNARHFTDFSLKHATGDANAKVDAGLQTIVDMMNPVYFISRGNEGCAKHWWIRHGTRDSDTSLPVIVNLATSLENQGKDVNAWLYWDAGHGADQDPEDFIAWIGRITGYGK